MDQCVAMRTLGGSLSLEPGSEAERMAGGPTERNQPIRTDGGEAAADGDIELRVLANGGGDPGLEDRHSAAVAFVLIEGVEFPVTGEPFAEGVADGEGNRALIVAADSIAQ